MKARGDRGTLRRCWTLCAPVRHFGCGKIAARGGGARSRTVRLVLYPACVPSITGQLINLDDHWPKTLARALLSPFAGLHRGHRLLPIAVPLWYCDSKM
jgi:hypothetical protein